jgi:hypothetical protein
VLQKKQGSYCLLGNGDTAMVHHPQYVFDDAILPMGAAYWVALAENYLRWRRASELNELTTRVKLYSPFGDLR